MALREWLSNILGANTKRETVIVQQSYQTMSASSCDIYKNDIVECAIWAIASELSKINLKSVIETYEPHKINVVNDDITTLFSTRPNPLMTSSEFFERVAYLWIRDSNVYIYRKYKEYKLENKNIELHQGFYICEPISTEFLLSSYNKIFLKLTFKNGESHTLPYSDFIHLRRNYGKNEFFGGGENGYTDTTALSKIVEVQNDVIQGLPKAINASLNMNGILTVPSTADAQALRKERDSFEQNIFASSVGISALGYAGNFTPINIDPKVIDKDVMTFLDEKLLRPFGASPAILSGDFSELQSSAFYQKCIEPFIVRFEQAITSVCYSSSEQQKGRRAKIYDRRLEHMSMDTKLKVAELFMPPGYITEDEARELIGYEPNGREYIAQSLNWIDKSKATAYQLSRPKEK